jgi:hypothetical protein
VDGVQWSHQEKPGRNGIKGRREGEGENQKELSLLGKYRTRTKLEKGKI